ncbi:MAG TPA: hypothetical protein PK876_10590 [Elusimicrobiota bacterium]|nr:hypothetical protein [Elusimicrobiota bacterium]
MKRIFLSSSIVCLAGIGLSLFWLTGVIATLLGLLGLGMLAGWFSRRHGWLCGIIVGLPVGLVQLSHRALLEEGTLQKLFLQPDYWRLLVPVTIVMTGVAILGGIVGVWMVNLRINEAR